MADQVYIRVPDFQYAVDYYPQIVARLRESGRVNVPEITNEDPREPFIQGERAFALAAHYNNVLLDMVANNLYMATATLPQSVKYLLELINSKLLPAGPAEVDVIGKLVGRYNTDIRLLETYRKFSTKRSADQPEMVFENPSTVELTTRNDEQGLTYAYSCQSSLTGSGASLSSVEPDVVTDETYPFLETHKNDYMDIASSSYGNICEEKRIIEVFDEHPTVTGTYRKVRLKNASFVAESSVAWVIRAISNNKASDLNTGSTVDILSGTPAVNDRFYFGNADVMFDRMDWTITVPGNSANILVWEFFDPTDSTIAPDLVEVDTPSSGQIRFEIETLVGTDPFWNGVVEVQHVPTGVKSKGYSTYSSGKNYIIIDGYLDQASPSTNENDYIVSCRWKPITITEDTTIDTVTFRQNGRIVFELPQDRDDSWYKFSAYDNTSGEENLAYFLRLRSAFVAGTVSTASRLRIDQGEQYIMFRCIQGQTVEDVIGSSNGEANQTFTLDRTPYVLQSARIYVDEGAEFEWAVVDSLIRSLSTDRHVVVDPQVDGTAIVHFGTGQKGKIPLIGTNNIRAIYRIGADRDGNIGANTLTINRDGVGVFKEIWNPRQGFYWIEADWASQAALERAKERSAKLITTMYRAVSPADIEILAQRFINVNGSRPVRRAQAFEESFGPKTVELVVCGGGGAALTYDEKTELQEYFNGGTEYGYSGVAMANSQIYVTNYTPRTITLDVRIEAYSVITEVLVKRVLQNLLSPTAVQSRGIGYVWRFGQTVTLSRIIHEVFLLSPGNIFDVDITSPTLDIELSTRELPVLDIVNTQVTIISPQFTLT